MAFEFLMSQNVALNAQQAQIVWIKEEPFNFFHRSARLPRYDVVAVNARRDVPVGLAPFAQTSSPFFGEGFEFLPRL